MSANALAKAAADEMAALADKLNAGRMSLPSWRKAMDKELADYHTAAFMLGTAQRLGVKPDSPLISRKRLSNAERADISAAIHAQRGYLSKFEQAVKDGHLSPAQIRARAASYGDSVRTTESQAATFGADLPFYPGDGSTVCLTHCRCSWQQRADQWYWTLGLVAEHCDDCRRRADHGPYNG